MARTARIHRIAQQCVLLCAVWLALAASLSAQSTEWKPYTYTADGFQATFPGLPEIQKKQVAAGSGPLELRSYNVLLNSAILFVAVCDYGAAASGKDPSAMLQGAKNGALLNSSSRLTRERTISLSGNPGIEYQAQNDSALFTARIYMRGATLYQTIVVTPLGKLYPDAARFFDSFLFIDRSTN